MHRAVLTVAFLHIFVDTKAQNVSNRNIESSPSHDLNDFDYTNDKDETFLVSRKPKNSRNEYCQQVNKNRQNRPHAENYRCNIYPHFRDVETRRLRRSCDWPPTTTTTCPRPRPGQAARWRSTSRSTCGTCWRWTRCRAWNEAFLKVREDFTITEKALTRDQFYIYLRLGQHPFSIVS